MFQIKKGEGPRHPPPIAGFSSFCNLITKDNITDITKKVNHKLSLFRLYSIWLFLCTIQINCLIFLHRYICTCITLISSLSAYPSPSIHLMHILKSQLHRYVCIIRFVIAPSNPFSPSLN